MSRGLLFVLIFGFGLLSVAARKLKDAETGNITWDGEATSVAARQRCGGPGQPCCTVVDADTSLSVFCADDTLYCQSFPEEPVDNNTVVLMSYTGTPSLCLPKPAECGGAGQPCCPLTGNMTDPSLRCTEADTLCLSDPAFSQNLTGLLTPTDYTTLRNDPSSPLSQDAQRSVWGSCVAFQPEACGRRGGLCGQRLPAPATQCPDELQGCEEGSYCEPQLGQLQDVGICRAVPDDAGKLGSKCLPAGNYSDGFLSHTPFCNDSSHISEYDVYCHAPLGRVEESECRRLPRSPDECGGVGKACCPSSYHITTDKALPPICQDGAYCASAAAGEEPRCVANPPDAGKPGQQCLATSAKGTTLYSCDEGSYCEGGLDAEEQGATPDQLTCKPCGSVLDVPLPYQAVCGIGIDAGLAAANQGSDGSGGSASGGDTASDSSSAVTKPSSAAPGSSLVAVETSSVHTEQVAAEEESCEHCMRRRTLRRLALR